MIVGTKPLISIAVADGRRLTHILPSGTADMPLPGSLQRNVSVLKDLHHGPVVTSRAGGVAAIASKRVSCRPSLG